jgi:hypothetical protein
MAEDEFLKQPLDVEIHVYYMNNHWKLTYMYITWDVEDIPTLLRLLHETILHQMLGVQIVRNYTYGIEHWGIVSEMA